MNIVEEFKLRNELEQTEVHFLGKLCKRGHDWDGRGQSLRYKTGKRACVICRRMRETDGPRKTMEERFWEKVDKTGECWEWQACKEKSGYGSLMVDGKKAKAHRISWELAYGPIPDGLYCLHRCDVRSCIRPSHLFLGTHIDNINDMDAKGRRKAAFGEQSGMAKLTEAEVKEIKKLYTSGERNLTALGRRFGVRRITVANICRGKTWKHIN